MIKVACDFSDSNEPPMVVMLGTFDSSFVSLLAEYASIQSLDSSFGNMPDLFVVCLTDRFLELAEICHRIQHGVRPANFLYIADFQTFKKYKKQIARISTPNCLLTTSVDQLLSKAIAEVSKGRSFTDPDIAGI